LEGICIPKDKLITVLNAVNPTGTFAWIFGKTKFEGEFQMKNDEIKWYSIPHEIQFLNKF